MRITQNAMTRSYMRNLNRSISNLTGSNDRLSSSRKFSKVSEDTASASKAFAVREQLYRGEQSMRNIENAQGELASVESNLQNINTLMQTVKERLLEGLNGTMGDSEKEVLAREIKNIKEELLQTINAKYGDKYIFGGTNNSTPPLSVASDGSILFNGAVVDQLFTDPASGKAAMPVYDSSTPPILIGYSSAPENEDIYIDVGLGLTMAGDSVDPRTAFKISVSGLDALGYGITDVHGVSMPNNLYSLLDKIASDLSAEDTEALAMDLTHLKDRTDALIMNITDIGSRTNFLEQTAVRLGNDNLNLKETQSDLETIRTEEEVIFNKTYETTWMVCLQLGSKLIPPSIFDFMR